MDVLTPALLVVSPHVPQIVQVDALLVVPIHVPQIVQENAEMVVSLPVDHGVIARAINPVQLVVIQDVSRVVHPVVEEVGLLAVLV